VIRDLKAAGYIASAPKEDEAETDTGATLYVEDPGPHETDRVMEIARAADPSVHLQARVIPHSGSTGGAS
jgi:hypothetical protein